MNQYKKLSVLLFIFMGNAKISHANEIHYMQNPELLPGKEYTEPDEDLIQRPGEHSKLIFAAESDNQEERLPKHAKSSMSDMKPLTPVNSAGRKGDQNLMSQDQFHPTTYYQHGSDPELLPGNNNMGLSRINLLSRITPNVLESNDDELIDGNNYNFDGLSLGDFGIPTKYETYIENNGKGQVASNGCNDCIQQSTGCNGCFQQSTGSSNGVNFMQYQPNEIADSQFQTMNKYGFPTLSGSSNPSFKQKNFMFSEGLDDFDTNPQIISDDFQLEPRNIWGTRSSKNNNIRRLNAFNTQVPRKVKVLDYRLKPSFDGRYKNPSNHNPSFRLPGQIGRYPKIIDEKYRFNQRIDSPQQYKTFKLTDKNPYLPDQNAWSNVDSDRMRFYNKFGTLGPTEIGPYDGNMQIKPQYPKQNYYPKKFRSSRLQNENTGAHLEDPESSKLQRLNRIITKNAGQIWELNNPVNSAPFVDDSKLLETMNIPYEKNQIFIPSTAKNPQIQDTIVSSFKIVNPFYKFPQTSEIIHHPHNFPQTSMKIQFAMPNEDFDSDNRFFMRVGLNGQLMELNNEQLQKYLQVLLAHKLGDRSGITGDVAINMLQKLFAQIPATLDIKHANMPNDQIYSNKQFLIRLSPDGQQQELSIEQLKKYLQLLLSKTHLGHMPGMIKDVGVSFTTPENIAHIPVNVNIQHAMPEDINLDIIKEILIKLKPNGQKLSNKQLQHYLQLLLPRLQTGNNLGYTDALRQDEMLDAIKQLLIRISPNSQQISNEQLQQYLRLLLARYQLNDKPDFANVNLIFKPTQQLPAAIPPQQHAENEDSEKPNKVPTIDHAEQDLDNLADNIFGPTLNRLPTGQVIHYPQLESSLVEDLTRSTAENIDDIVHRIFGDTNPEYLPGLFYGNSIFNILPSGRRCIWVNTEIGLAVCVPPYEAESQRNIVNIWKTPLQKDVEHHCVWIGKRNGGSVCVPFVNAESLRPTKLFKPLNYNTPRVHEGTIYPSELLKHNTANKLLPLYNMQDRRPILNQNRQKPVELYDGTTGVGKYNHEDYEELGKYGQTNDYNKGEHLGPSFHPSDSEERRQNLKKIISSIKTLVTKGSERDKYYHPGSGSHHRKELKTFVNHHITRIKHTREEKQHETRSHTDTHHHHTSHKVSSGTSYGHRHSRDHSRQKKHPSQWNKYYLQRQIQHLLEQERRHQPTQKKIFQTLDRNHEMPTDLLENYVTDESRKRHEHSAGQQQLNMPSNIRLSPELLKMLQNKQRISTGTGIQNVNGIPGLGNTAMIHNIRGPGLGTNVYMKPPSGIPVYGQMLPTGGLYNYGAPIYGGPLKLGTAYQGRRHRVLYHNGRLSIISDGGDFTNVNG